MPNGGERGIFEQGVDALIREKLALFAFCAARDEESAAATEAAFHEACKATLDFQLMLPSEQFLAMRGEAMNRLRGLVQEVDESTKGGEL